MANLREITEQETSALLAAETSCSSPSARIARRKLILHSEVPSKSRKNHTAYTASPTPVPTRRLVAVQPNEETIDALLAIRKTPFEHSFACRLYGLEFGQGQGQEEGLIAVDWETRTTWMELMADIREHYALKHADRERPTYIPAPIKYTSIHSVHLPQLLDLLSRAFWEDIDVSDFLSTPAAPDNATKYTVIATFKNLVVGATLLIPTSPQEVYIAYLVVRAGWEGNGVATSMLYHSICKNHDRDITLHVSSNNPAMLLYNRLGFKAEEFIVGFYTSYMDPNARGSKNAVRLRLRRLA